MPASAANRCWRLESSSQKPARRRTERQPLGAASTPDTLLGLALTACGAAPPAAGTTDNTTDSTPEADADTDADSDTDSDTDTDTDTDLSATPPVRFLALGDAGHGNDDQYAVAAAIGDVCARDGCDFALYLGDNFYDTGVDDVEDSQFREKFELPYADLNFPFYPVLGNHDYGGEGIGWELWKGTTYVEYSAYSDKWILPDLYYTHIQGDATFFGLDTTQIFWGVEEDQLDWLLAEEAAARTTWKIAYGHHPYVSNGTHGNAGEYDGLGWIPIVNGQSIADFIEAGVCGNVDVYLSGHDHSLQWLEDPCGTEFLVSGGGSGSTDIEGDGPAWFDQAIPGFLWMEIDGTTFTGVFYDASGAEIYRRSFSK